VPVEVRTFANEYEELEALLLENLFRDKTQFQKIKEGTAWEKIEAEKGKQRMSKAAFLEQEQRKVKKQGVENFPHPVDNPQNNESEQGKSRDKIAKKVGLGSGRDYDKGKKVVAAIEAHKTAGNKQQADVLSIALEKSTDGALKRINEQVIDKITPEQAENIKTGAQSVNEIYREIKKEERQDEKRQQQLTPTKDLPINEFEVILADPPWRYDFSSTETREIENQYPTMELEDICELKVPASKDCVLFLWATAPKLKEALKVIDAWGFEYKTHAVWDKQKIGMGYYFRGQHELLLVAIKGVPGTPLPEVRPASIISSPRTNHSEKPILVYELIEQMYPNRNYLEMFARNERNGWTAWGNQM
jgi:N6-adenosine-specific RNA methylase IME4